MDNKTPEERSRNMSRIRSRDTKPELILRKALFNQGFRYRVNYKLTGKPDIVFVKKKLAIFVDGCFWHGCPACYRRPKSNTDYWDKKVETNMNRDKANSGILKEQGWTVMRFWEHDVKKNLSKVIETVVLYLRHEDS